MASSEENTAGSLASLLNLVALVLGIVVLALMGFRTIGNTDFYTHLVTGKAIATSGVGTVDTLAFTSEGKEWVKPNWMYDRMMYMFGAGAFTTLLHIILVVGAFVLILPTVTKWSSGTAIGLALVICAWLLAPRFEPRSTMFALIFPALFIAVLEKKNLVNWLPFAILIPIQILWANIHTSFLIGPIIVVVYLVEANFRTKAKFKKSRMILLGALAASCLIAPVLNPEFGGLYGYVMDGWKGSQFTQSQFWVSPFLDEFAGRKSFPVIHMILGLVACGLIFYRDKLPLAATLLALVGAFLAFNRYEEGIELFTILLFPFLCLSLQAIGAFFVLQGKNVGKAVSGLLPLVSFSIVLILGLATIISLVSNSYYVKAGSISSFGLGANDEIVPAEAMEIINGDDFPERFLNLPIDGAFVALKSDGKQVFIDQRARFHGREDLQHAMQGLMAIDEEAAKDVYDKWNPEAIVINTCAPNAEEVAFRMLVGSNWRPAYFDGTTLIIVAPTESGRKLLENKDIQAKGLEIFEAARDNYYENLGSMVAAPISARLTGGASMLMVFKRYKEAYELYELLKAGAPTMHTPYIQQGVCKFNLDEIEEAMRLLIKATEMAPEDPSAWRSLSLVYEKNGMAEQAQDAMEKAKILSGGDKEGKEADSDEEAATEE